MGYKPVLSVHALSPVGVAALRCRKGSYSVEVSTELAPSQEAVRASGATHGYAYPLLNKPEAAALAFFGGAS
jgi:hypothetical protein